MSYVFDLLGERMRRDEWHEIQVAEEGKEN
jgi:hypothetical protein